MKLKNNLKTAIFIIVMETGENNELQSIPTLNTVLIQNTQKNNLTKKKNKQRMCCYNCIIVYYLLFFFCILSGMIILLNVNKNNSYYQYDYYLDPIYY